ncbi:MAG TPA: hypothetical protein VLH56_19590 [Dissulfurispiraceae bacterium]|nr:hypothetical protein [Dissulfurispiraceae bacterium]
MKRKRKLTPKQAAALAKGRQSLKTKRANSGKRSPVVTSLRKAEKTMAKSKKTAKRRSVSPVKTQIVVAGKTKRRKSRGRMMGGMGGLNMKKIQGGLVDTAIGAAGGIGGAMLAKFIPSQDAKVKAGAVMLAGLLLGSMIRNAKVQVAGTGMAIIGAMGLAKALKPDLPTLTGDADFESLLVPGYSGLSEVAGLNEVAGLEEIGFDDSDDLVSVGADSFPSADDDE